MELVVTESALSIRSKGDTDFDKKLQSQWEQAKQTGALNFVLDTVQMRRLDGKFGFCLQLNEDRFLKRRKPESIQSIRQPFDASKFHFAKVARKEVLFEISENEQDDKKAWIIVNNSPLFSVHVLLASDVMGLLPQENTEASVKQAVEVLLLSGHRGWKGAYNSLGAYASVNNLHWHFWLCDKPILVETMKCDTKLSKYLYTSSPPTSMIFSICFALRHLTELNTIVRLVAALLDWLVSNDIAHNVFLTRGDDWDADDSAAGEIVRIMVWPRQPSFGVKDLSTTSFNCAVAEIGGYINVRGRDAFERLTEEDVLKRIGEFFLEDAQLEKIIGFVRTLSVG